MIKKLTKHQEQQIPVYLNKWLDVGHRTNTIDKEKAKESIDFIYTDILNIDKPKCYVFLDSPMACNLAINLLKDSELDLENSQLSSQLYSQLDSQLDSQLHSQLGSQLYSQLSSQLSSQLRSQLGSQLRSQLRSQLDRQLYSQLDSQLDSQLLSQLSSQLYSQLSSQLSSQLRSQLDSQLGSQLGSQLDSQLDSQLSNLKLKFYYDSCSNINPRGYYYYTYDFILNELFPNKIKEFTKFNKYMDCIKNIHLTYMFNDIVFISDFPERILLNNENKLHSTNSYSLKYRDNYGIFSVNGFVKNVKKIAKTKLAKKLIDSAIEEDDYLIIPEL